MPFYVYSILSAGGQTIYVGCTGNLKNRLNSHRSYLKRHYGDIDYVILETTDGPKEAVRLEKLWIKTMADRGEPLINRDDNENNTTLHYPYTSVTVKLDSETARRLKELAALRGLTMIETAHLIFEKELSYWRDRMYREELERKQQESEMGQ